MMGSQQRAEVIMRKRSENRGYADENIRDSIVMGDVSSTFADLSKFDLSVSLKGIDSCTLATGRFYNI